MPRDAYQYFRPEARDLVEQLGKGVLDLEKGGRSAEIVPRLLRLAHTLKGAARVVRQGEIADRAHGIEDALAPFRESAGDVPSERIDAVLSLVDDISAGIAGLSGPVPQGQSAPQDDVQTVRAGTAEMDALLDSITESHAHLSTLRTALRSMDRTRDLAGLLVRQLAFRGTREGVASAGTASLNASSTAEELRQIVGGLERHLASGVDHMDRELRQVREAAEQLRFAPARTMFTSLERTARDAAQTLGKRVVFESSGGDVRLEAHVLAAVQRALLQATRNAVAHGIEAEGDRKTAGKPLAGRVTIDVARRGRRVVFRCRDDGRGVDLEAVRRTAVRQGLSSSETRNLSAQDLIRLLLRGGISTSDAVTEVSGRGIGLDVMREVTDQLRGDVTLQTEEGVGTTFELVIPLSLATLEVLIVEAVGVSATIPLDSVREAVRVASSDVSRTDRGESIAHGGTVVPFIALRRALRAGSVPPRANQVWSTVIVEGAKGVAAVGVDRLVGTARVVVRPLPQLAAADAVVAGTYLDAEGNPQLVLDHDGLVAEAARESPADVAVDAVHRPILVVDDSLTTRMLEQSILESAGYAVDTAISGEQALAQARRKPYALFLVDVEMPGMDGYTFIERVRSDATLRDVPAILVTSRSSGEDRQRGMQVGAQDYIVKSEFNQSELLARIRQLLA